MKKKDAKIEKIRDELCEIGGVKAKAVVIATDDGEIIGSGDVSLAQVSARIMAMAEGASVDLAAEPPDKIVHGSKSETISVIRVNPEILLAVRVKPEANEHLILLEMLRAAKEIKKLTKKRRRENGGKTKARKR